MADVLKDGWTPWGGESERSEDVAGMSLRVGAKTFGPSHDTTALGALCFAYGLDIELFHAGNTPPLSGAWLVWHFCYLVSRWKDPDIERFAADGLACAMLIAGKDAADVQRRFLARLTLVKEISARDRSVSAGLSDEK